MKTIVFDIETQKSFDEIKGQKITALLMSVAVTLEAEIDCYRRWEAHQVPELIEELESADLIVGFNQVSFDLAVIGGGHLASKCFDILADLTKRLGHRVKLDSCTSATLGAKKSGDGLKAIAFWREGKLEELFEYCKDDVRLTAELWRHGAEKGFVLFEDLYGRVHRRCSVSWPKAPPRRVVAIAGEAGV